MECVVGTPYCPEGPPAARVDPVSSGAVCVCGGGRAGWAGSIC